MKTIVSILLICGLSLVLFSCASSISGQLKSVDGGIVTSGDARVNVSRLNDEKDATPLILNVNDDGSFTTGANLKDGSYLVEILVPGFKSTSQRVELKGSSAVDFTLTPIKSAANSQTTSFGVMEGGAAGRGEGGALLTPPQL